MATKPISIAVRSITSVSDTTEMSPDEPYVLVVAVDLRQAIPPVEVTKYGPWGDVEMGETHATVPVPPNLPPEVIESLNQFLILRRPFWGMDNLTPSPLNEADLANVIFIVTVMEWDDGKTATARELAKMAAIASIAASSGMSRSVRVNKLIKDVEASLGMPTGFPNFDDIVQTRELVLTGNDLRAVASKGSALKKLSFSGDGGKFDVTFELKAA